MTPYRKFSVVFFCLALAILAGCSTSKKTADSGGGYYKDDGPGSNIPRDLKSIPNAVPRIETHAPANFRPYVVFGKTYTPVSDERPFRQEGTASWYGRKFHGKKTANGETYDMYVMSAAHPTLPLPSYARVTHARSGKSVIVRVNDRGPFHSSRIIDLSYVAADRLGLIGPGSGQVIVEAITNADIRAGRAPGPSMIAAAPSEAPPAAVPPPASAPASAPQGRRQPSPTPARIEQADASTPDALAVLEQQIYLQFGAFGAMQAADGLVQKLNQQISQLENRTAHVDTSADLYRVQVGPYPDRTAAINAAVRIQEVTGLRPTVAVR
ncbi:MAG TPA: septal ring lytic transglycosylase RlpA family protein [Candidimonas sp.]|nr:septal ring lytic transglycosylase RlpA family protein [Candidimonas sp.]